MKHCYLTLLVLWLAAPLWGQSTIVYSGIKNMVIPTNFDGLYLDIDTGITGGPELAGLDINPFFGGLGIANTANFQPVRSGTNVLDPYLNLAPGTLVSAASTFAIGEGGTDRNHIGSSAGQFTASVEGYIGFRFTPNSGGAVRYGWMRLAVTPNTAGAMIKDWAYNDNGAAISVGDIGAVPEPHSLVLFSLASLLVLRRKR